MANPNPAQTGTGAVDQTDQKDSMILLNDLVYKLEPDMSVAINRTHKTHYFQQPKYTNNQPAICILNSGADYIDTRRSFLHFEVELDTIVSTIGGGNDIRISAYNNQAVIHGLFGPNGSILNLIDTVTITTRSGDELSRTTDLAMLSNMLLPLHHGKDWRDTVGQLMGFGDAVYGTNNAGVIHPHAKRTYAIPLYVLSPLFSYGRLMPAMLMSGLRIQITWHTPAKAFAQCVCHHPRPTDKSTYLGRAIGVGHNVKSVAYNQDPANNNTTNFTSRIENVDFATSTDADNYDIRTMPICFDPRENWWGTRAESFETPRVVDMGTNVQKLGGVHTPGYRFVQEAKNFNKSYEIDEVQAWPQLDTIQNPDALTEYAISSPQLSLCSVQLSDAIQRSLNEFSAVNGLEIVYTDYDLTTAPVTATENGTSVYTEVRKSASRALAAYARLTPIYKKQEVEIQADSNASVVIYQEDLQRGARGWLDYQWQLGSLYFPQQKVAGKTAYDIDPICYAHTLEAFGRFDGKKVPMLTLRGETQQESTVISADTHMQNPFYNNNCSRPDLLSQERFYSQGKAGSFVGGGHVVSVSLERSTMFNLSGIPINNSRVLALRGNYSGYPTSYCDRYRLNVYLKYVKMARVFLLNTEVEQ